jgi:hypothetical protein
MRFSHRWIALISIIIASGQAINSQSHAGQSGEQHQKNERHHEGVNRRGDREMGFSHAKTAHHFRLKSDGGIIEVTANGADDTAIRDQIRQHLKQIAQKFSEGDFSAPIFIHGQIPPGVEAMKRLKAEIKYQYGEIERGARVRISTGNTEAIKAIHKFLRFQIHDHHTGDTTEIEKTPGN